MAERQQYYRRGWSKKCGTKLFEKGADSVDERIGALYNSFRHTAADSDDIFWLTNDAAWSGHSSVSFAELEDTIRDCASVVQAMTSSAGMERATVALQGEQ